MKTFPKFSLIKYKNMALRICSKLEKAIIPKNCKRLISKNAEKLARVPNVLEENRQQYSNEGDQVNATGFNKLTISSNHRTSPTDNPRLLSSPFEPEREIVHRNLENKYLQPATLPSYCDKPIFDSQFMATLQDPQIQRAQTITLNNSASQRIMESLKEKQSKNYYKKFPKLMLNPFPDPVKAIFSPYTLSDQEKAQQMLDDQRMIRMTSLSNTGTRTFSTNKRKNSYGMNPSKKFHGANCILNFDGICGLEDRSVGFYGTRSLTSKTTGNFPTNFISESEQFYGANALTAKTEFGGSTSNSMVNGSNERRFYSKKKKDEICKDKNKCPKEKTCLPRRCDKIRIKGCPPPRPNTICKRKQSEVHCKKVEAPYPSYSESCYMEPKPRKTECDLCPWTRRHNPNFKDRLRVPPKKYHTSTNSFDNRGSPISIGQNMVRKLETLSTECCENQPQKRMQLANYTSQLYESRRKLPRMNFIECGIFDNVGCSPFSKGKCDRVEKDDTKCKKISPGSCQGAKLRKPIDYLKSYIDKRKGKKGDTSCRSLPSTNLFQSGYCHTYPTVLSEAFVKNDDLMSTFEDGDDLGDFRINKAKLARILSTREVFEITCKKGEKIIPDYPKDCEKPYQDASKLCPSGLTHKKSKKDRLKKKKPKANKQ